MFSLSEIRLGKYFCNTDRGGVHVGSKFKFGTQAFRGALLDIIKGTLKYYGYYIFFLIKRALFIPSISKFGGGGAGSCAPSSYPEYRALPVVLSLYTSLNLYIKIELGPILSLNLYIKIEHGPVTENKLSPHSWQ